MKFAPNRLYIESYSKCPNCGVLLYDKPANTGSDAVTVAGQTYCSAWCAQWEADRTQRRQADRPDAS